MAANDNKFVDALVRRFLQAQLDKGFWPEVGWKRERGMISFSLFEYGAVMNAIRLGLHFTLLGLGYPQGIYEKLRSTKWQATLAQIEKTLRPVTSADIKKGQLLLMHNLPGNRGPRHATVIEGLYDFCVLDINTEERNGCVSEIGSAYLWEIQCILLDGVYCPLAMTEEERAFEKQVEKTNVGAAKMAQKFYEAAC